MKPCAKILFIGDSITDAGRQRPKAEGFPWTLGNGYVALVEAMIRTRRPGWRPCVANAGVSAETIRDLARRWEADVRGFGPDVLVILVGINDVWRQFDAPWDRERHVLRAEYRETLRRLAAAEKERGVELVLVAPFFMEANRSDPMRVEVDAYGVILAEVATELGLARVDLQAEFDRLLETGHSSALSHDRVHPDLAGHLLIAEAVFAALDGLAGRSASPAPARPIQ
jgi:lysophospholipase L1-like esterase